MIKTVLIAIGIGLVCALENIGHYFGFCFHGYMANLIGGLSVFGFTIVMFLNNIIGWLNTKRKHNKPHRCNHEHHHAEENNE
jgi:mannose/fructose/N-acetylgalactosamine-specific phosphotransferase system component IIC